MTNRYSNNMFETPEGNAIKEKTTLSIVVENAEHISGAIYKNGFPVIAIFGMGDTASVLVERSGLDLKGDAELKIRAWLKTKKGFGVDDSFVIV